MPEDIASLPVVVLEAHGAEVLCDVVDLGAVDGVALHLVVQLCNEDWRFDEDVCLKVHEGLVPAHVVVVVIPDVRGQVSVNEGEDVEKYSVFKGGCELFILIKYDILPVDGVASLFEVSDDQVSVLVVKSHYVGTWLELQVQQVKKMDAFLLNIVVFSELCIYPLETGGVSCDDVVVINITRLSDDAQEGSQLTPG